MADPRVHLFSNNASCRLGEDLDVGETSLTLENGKGALFPNPGVDEIFIFTIEDLVEGRREICYCTDRAGDVLDIERGQEGTEEQNWTQSNNVVVQHRVTAGTLEHLQETGGGGAGGDLDDLDDVEITSPTAGDVLTWDGYAWVNEQPASGGDGDGKIERNPQSGTSYTLDITDVGKCVEMTNGSANTVTVPPEADEPWEDGHTLLVRQMGSGVTTIAAGSGVTIRAPRGLSIIFQYGSVTLHYRGSNEWCIEGSC